MSYRQDQKRVRNRIAMQANARANALAKEYKKKRDRIKKMLSDNIVSADTEDKLIKLLNQIDEEINEISRLTSKAITDAAVTAKYDAYKEYNYILDKELQLLTGAVYKSKADIRKEYNEELANGKTRTEIQNKSRQSLKDKVKTVIAAAAIGAKEGAIRQKLKSRQEVDDILLSDQKQTKRHIRHESLKQMSDSKDKITAQAAQNCIEFEYVWQTQTDEKVRASHKNLHDQRAEIVDDKPVFTAQYKGGLYTASAPRLFGVPALDYNCRCARIDQIKDIPDSKRKRLIKENGEWQKTYEGDQGYQNWLRDWKKRN